MNISLVNKTLQIDDVKVVNLREDNLVNLTLKTDYILLETNEMGVSQNYRIYPAYVTLPAHSSLADLFATLSTYYSLVKNEPFLDREITGTTRTLLQTEVMNTTINNYGQGEANINITLPTPAQGYKFVVQVTEPSVSYFRITSTGNIIVDGVQADYAQFATPKQGDYFKVFTEKIIPTTDHFITPPVIAISTSDHTKAHTTTFTYYIAGIKYSTSAAELVCGEDVIPKGKFGCVAFDVDGSRSITLRVAPGNTTGYNNPALAIAGLPAVASGYLRLGYITASGLNETGGSNFTFGTTALDSSHTLVSLVTSAIPYVPTYKYIVTTGITTLSALGGVAANSVITGSTKTKVTYDAKGLVTSGEDATTADIAASTNKNYVTDSELILLLGTGATEGATLKIVSGVPTWVAPA